MYNKLAEEKVIPTRKKFRDKQTAIKAVYSLLPAEISSETAAEPFSAVPEEKTDEELQQEELQQGEEIDFEGLSKREASELIFDEMIKDDYSRQDILAEFMDKLDMSKAGASTYLANVEKKRGVKFRKTK